MVAGWESCALRNGRYDWWAFARYGIADRPRLPFRTACPFSQTAPNGLVIKTLGSNILYEYGIRKIAHTRRLTDDDLADVTGLELTAHQFQDWIPKSHDVRVIAVGTEQFAVEIRTRDPEALIDWRKNYDALSYSRTELPRSVAKNVRAFMSVSGLNFSALDFVVTPEGQWIFLESNSGGHYGWLTPTLGTSVSDAIATVLAEGVPQ